MYAEARKRLVDWLRRQLIGFATAFLETVVRDRFMRLPGGAGHDASATAGARRR